MLVLRRIVVPFLAALVAAVLFSSAPISYAHANANELRVRWWQDLVSLDPPHIRDSLATEVGYKIYSTLVRVKSGTFDELVPDLAQRWEVSSDGLVYTFHLRDDAVWHKGFGTVTAEDVVFSLLRHKDEEAASQFATEASVIKSVKALDDHTVQVSMNEAYPGFLLEFLAYRPGFIVNRRALEELGERYTEAPIGSGAFVFEGWSPRQSVKLVRNDEYYGDAGSFERVTYVQIPEESVFEVALQRGDVDIGYFLEAEVQARVLNNPGIETVTIPAPRTFYIQLNQAKEPFNNLLVRQALWYALDKELIVEGVLGGQGEVANTMLNSHVFGRANETDYSYDPERAKELLAEAGYPSGFSATLLIYPPYGIPDMAAAVQDMWREVGVEVEIVQREWAQHVELRRSGSFDLAIQPMLRLGPDQYLTPTMHSASIPYPNASRFSNSEIDALIDEARVTADDAKRRDLYHEIQRLAQERVPVIPLLNPVFVLAFQPGIDNAKPGLLTINVSELSVTE
jgi:peptide/nickel transport system substrate-binding protein